MVELSGNKKDKPKRAVIIEDQNLSSSYEDQQDESRYSLTNEPDILFN